MTTDAMPVLYDNENYFVRVGESPPTAELPEPSVMYVVVHKNTGVDEAYTNQLFEAMQQAYWLNFMLLNDNWLKAPKEKADGFLSHFNSAGTQNKTARELTGAGPLN